MATPHTHNFYFLPFNLAFPLAESSRKKRSSRVCEKGQQDGKEDRRINPSAEDLDRSKIKPQLHHTQEKHGGGGLCVHFYRQSAKRITR
jgi:hypothetical protein